MYQCFYCLSDSVVKGSTYGFEECGYEGEGILNVYHCINCGAEIEYRIPMNQEEEPDDDNKMTIYDFIDDKGVNENGEGRLDTF